MERQSWILISNAVITLCYVGGLFRITALLFSYLASKWRASDATEKTISRIEYVLWFLVMVSGYYAFIEIIKKYVS